MNAQPQPDALGPIDIAVIGYPAGAPLTGTAMPVMLDLVDRGIIRVLDAMFVIKDADGSFAGFDATDLEPGTVGDLTVFEGASSGLLGEEDAATAAETLEPGTAAAMIVYENRWAAPFIAAVHENGGVFLDNQRITHAEVLETLDALEAN
jgi:Family of unknown function (DUF6325)